MDDTQPAVTIKTGASKRIQELEARLHAWESLGVELIQALDYIVSQRISVMASESRHAEIQRENQQLLQQSILKIQRTLKPE